MSVKSILNEKGRQVITVYPDTSVKEAVRLLHDNRIGAVIVIEPGDKVVGIFAERDVVAAVAQYGTDCLDRPVSSAMWTNVFSCSEETGIEELMEMMSNRRARHFPVEKNDRLVGIVSIGDAVKSHIRAIEREAEEIKAYIAG